MYPNNSLMASTRLQVLMDAVRMLLPGCVYSLHCLKTADGATQKQCQCVQLAGCTLLTCRMHTAE